MRPGRADRVCKPVPDITMPMTNLEYLVEPYGRFWTVSYQGLRNGRYPDRRTALRAAVRDARCLRRRNVDISVRVCRRDGRYRPVSDRLLRQA